MKKMRKLSTVTGTLPTLPFDLVVEIFCRLPVKLLLQLRCLAKSWKSLISDPKFKQKHLQLSKTSHNNHHLIVNTKNPKFLNLLSMKDSTILSVFSAAMSNSDIRQTKLRFPDILNRVGASDLRFCSCDGIICFSTAYGTIAGHSVVLWNPSIRRFNMFPALGNQGKKVTRSKYSFGYDNFTHTYKIVAVSFFSDKSNEVRVYTLGTDHSWRRIQDLPCYGSTSSEGVFARSTINWFARDALSSSSCNIVSLDLKNESYQKLLKPNLDENRWTLGVLRDSLCIFAGFETFVDIWIMKEYDNEKPWTKLYRLPYMKVEGLYPNGIPLYITEDDQVLMYCRNWVQYRFAVYDSKRGTFNLSNLDNFDGFMIPKVYVESLISPCF